MNFLCRLGIHRWYHFDKDGGKQVCRWCGKLQHITWVGWDTEGYVSDPENIIAYFEGEKKRHEEWCDKKRQEAEKKILQAKDYVPSINRSEDDE